MNFSANCICRELVVVDDSTPAVAFGAPADVKICRAAGAGGAKLAWFAMLKTSQRNCALNVSEIRRIGLFLNNEKSMSLRPGPITVLRPPSPRRFAQNSEPVGNLVVSPEAKFLHCAPKDNGALGRVKQAGL